MATEVPDFPLPVKMVYRDDGSARSAFIREVDRMTTDAKQRFETRFAEIGQIVEKSVSGFSSGGFNFRVDIPGLRQTAADADFTVQRLTLMRDAAQRVTGATNDTSSAAFKYAQALQAQVNDAQAAKRAADDQVRTYAALETEMDRLVRKNDALAQSYRDTYAEQARAANLAHYSQQAVNSAYAPGLLRQPKSARDSASVFENNSYRSSVDARSGIDRLLGGDASLDRAAASGATLDQVLGRVVQKGPEVTAELKRVTQAEQELARATAFLRAELDPTIMVQQRYEQQLDTLDRALRRGIIAETDHARLQGQAREQYDLNRLAMDRLVGTNGALRQATLQSGQQLQDIAISLYSGQQASIVFAQQLPQLAFGLSGLEGSANKAHDRIGRMATMLSGPWGLAVGVAIGLAVDLASSFIDMGDDADKAGTKTFDFSKKIDILTLSARDARDAMAQLAEEAKRAIPETGTFFAQRQGDAQRTITGANVLIPKQKEIVADLETRVTAATAAAAINPTLAPSLYTLVEKLKEARQTLKLYEEMLKSAEVAEQRYSIGASMREVIGARDAATAATNRYNEALGRLQARREESKKVEGTAEFKALPAYAQRSVRAEGGYISDTDFRRELDRLKAELETAKKAASEAKRTADKVTTDFISPVSGGRITGQFNEQRTGRRHAGVDIAVPVGTQVKAPAGGVIIESGVLGGYGNVVFIDHGGGTITRLAHLSRIDAVKGQVVGQGQVVGLSGGARGAPGAGNSRGPHLHQETIVNGKPVNPLTGRFATDPAKAEQDAQKAQEKAARDAERQVAHMARLSEFAEDAGDRVASMRRDFEDTPAAIARGQDALSRLDDLAGDINKKVKEGLDPQVADDLRAGIEAARAAIDTSWDEPFRKMIEAGEEQLQVQRLLAQGRTEEAEVLERQLSLKDRMAPLDEAQVARLREMVAQQNAINQQVTRTNDLMNAQLGVLDAAKSGLKDVLSGRKTDIIGNLKQSLKDLQGARLFDSIFGDVFDQIENELRKKTPLGKANARLTEGVDTAATQAERLAGALDTAATAVFKIATAAENKSAGVSGGDDDIGLSSAEIIAGLHQNRSVGWNGKLNLPHMISLGGAANDNGGLVVRGGKSQPVEIKDLSIQQIADKIALGIVNPVLSGMDTIFNVKFFGKLSPVLSEAMSGYIQGGIPGAILGGLKGIDGLPTKLDQLLGKGKLESEFDAAFQNTGLDKALKGAGTGTTVAGVSNALGIGMSTTGSQIGGALGGLTGIPGGDIIGAIAGGIIGKMIGGTKRGSATIGGVNGELGISGTRGNSGSFIKAASGSADGIIASVDRIAQAFGASIDASLGKVSIGIRDGKYRVDTTGSGITKTSRGAQDFGKDGADAAARAAALDLIQDGVIVGLRQGVQVLLKSAKDLDKGLQDALDFQSVFDRLKAIKDPVGAALDTVDREFARLRKLAEAAGEGMAEVEELYLIERTKAIEAAKKQMTASLQGLYDDLTIGDRGLSLRSRLSSAQAAYDPLKARVQAGDVTAYDDFAAAAQTLLGISRELNGSTTGYFDLFNEVKTVTKTALDASTAVANASANRDSPFSNSAVPANDNSAVVSAIDAQTQAIVNALTQYLGANNVNQAAILAALQSLNINGGRGLLDAVGNGGSY